VVAGSSGADTGGRVAYVKTVMQQSSIVTAEQNVDDSRSASAAVYRPNDDADQTHQRRHQDGMQTGSSAGVGQQLVVVAADVV